MCAPEQTFCNSNSITGFAAVYKVKQKTIAFPLLLDCHFTKKRYRCERNDSILQRKKTKTCEYQHSNDISILLLFSFFSTSTKIDHKICRNFWQLKYLL